MTFPTGLTIGHKPDADSYPKWGGAAGVRRWHRLGATAADIDFQISADGTGWAIHWPDWWLHGIVVKPGSVVPRLPIWDLTDDQIRGLVHKDGWAINTVREVLEAAAPLGMTTCLEAKSGPRFETAKVWEQVKADADATGCQVVAMTIQDYPDETHALARLSAAHAVGHHTMLLTRGRISPEWWNVLDAAKGSAAQVGTLPPGKVRVGGSIASATMYGCGVGPANAAAATTKVVALGGTPLPPPEVPPVPPTDPLAGPVPPDKIAAATKAGIVNAEAAAVASRAAGLRYWVACALLEKESGGRNVYGHDKGGAFSGYPGDVTEAGYKAFREFVVDRGMTSNGVGPCQITYAGALVGGVRSGGFFREMETRGLKPWVVADNMRFGFDLLLKHYEAHGHDWAKAGTAYNGAASYGTDLAARVKVWHDRFGIKEPVNP